MVQLLFYTQNYFINAKPSVADLSSGITIKTLLNNIFASAGFLKK